jgi:hemerythrin-like metal-binding protein
MDQTRKKLEWEDAYSVGVLEIDQQHKQMFAIINELIDAIGTDVKKERLVEIINSLVEYKKNHFATEEKYFKEFNFEGAAEHISAHKKFEEDLLKIQEECKDDVVMLAFELIDFIEDWLISHLMTMDQKYKKCFNEHGLK